MNPIALQNPKDSFGSVAGFQRATFVALGVSQNPSIFGLKSLLQIS